MSSSLVKLIDASLLPAAFLIFGKLLGLYIVTLLFGINAKVDFVDIFTINTSSLIVLSSYSDLLFILFMSTSFGIYVVRAIFFHDTHVDPRLVATLVKFNFYGIIKDIYTLYHEVFMWLVFTLIANLVVGLNVFLGKTYFWVFLLGIIVLVGLTVVLVKDVEKEVKRAKGNVKNAFYDKDVNVDVRLVN
jgi:hypothetical protein